MKLDLDAIAERCDKATSGPWDFRSGLGWWDLSLHPYLHNSETILMNYKSNPSRKLDAKFIAHARSDIPALLEFAREAKATLEFIESGTLTDGDHIFMKRAGISAVKSKAREVLQRWFGEA